MKTNKLFLMAVFFLLIIASACSAMPAFDNRLEGSGNVIAESRDVSDFDRVTLSGFGKVTIEQGNAESLTVRTDDNILPYIETVVKGDTLILGLTNAGQRKSISPSNGIEFDLVVKDLSRIDISGAGNIEMDALETSKLVVDLSGAGTFEIGSLTADELVVRQSGAGTMIISGQVKGQDVSHSGLGSYHAAELESETAILEISGAGTVTVWVTESLDIDISGLGNVIYYGNPRIIQNISGMGKLISAEK